MHVIERCKYLKHTCNWNIHVSKTYMFPCLTKLFPPVFTRTQRTVKITFIITFSVSSFPLPPETSLGSTFSNTSHFPDFVNPNSCNVGITNWEVFKTWVVLLSMGDTLLETLSFDDCWLWSIEDSKLIKEGSSIERSVLWKFNIHGKMAI